MSLRAKLLTELIKYHIKRHDLSLEAIRKRVEQLAYRYPAPSRSLRFELVEAGGVPAMWVTHRELPQQRAMLFLHGGGYCFSSSYTHRHVVAYLAKKTGFAILAPDYRLAPESPYPAALEDARSTWAWLRERFEAEHLAVGGDSAGGGLSLALLIWLRDAGQALPAAAFAWSPWTDLALTGESLAGNATSDAYLKLKTLQTMSAHYLVDHDPKDPLVSPLYGRLHDLPPTLIQVSDSEMLFDDSRRLATKMEDAAVDVRFEIWSEMPHVWHVLLGWVPESKAALRATSHFLKTHLA